MTVAADVKLSRPVILVIDDDPALCEALSLMLEERYHVAVASDGATALNVVQSEKIDLALLDLLLPKIDGLEVLTRLKGIAPSVPVIVLTGLGMAGPAATAMKLGAFDYVTKPFDSTLLSLIDAALASTTSTARPIDRERARTRADTSADLLLIGREVPVLITLQLLLGSRCTTHTAVVARSVTEVVQHLAQTKPTLAVLDDSLHRHDLLEIARMLRAGAGDCAMIVGCRPPWESSLLKELEMFWPDAVVPTPYDLNGLIHRVALVLTRQGVSLSTAGPLSLHITKAIDHVCQHYRTTTLKAAADAAGMSSSYLSRLFHAEFGVSFWALVTAVRIGVAKSLLAETQRKLNSIANLIGLSDAPHLCRLFERHTGQSPSDYRRSMTRLTPRT